MYFHSFSKTKNVASTYIPIRALHQGLQLASTFFFFTLQSFKLLNKIRIDVIGNVETVHNFGNLVVLPLVILQRVVFYGNSIVNTVLERNEQKNFVDVATKLILFLTRRDSYIRILTSPINALIRRIHFLEEFHLFFVFLSSLSDDFTFFHDTNGRRDIRRSLL